MATVIRRKALVNPHRRRKMSEKQIRIFGTPRQKAALKRRRKNAKSSTHRTRTRPVPKRATRNTPRVPRPRRNVSAIITAGLPALSNPHRKGSTMAKTKTKRRRTNAKPHTSYRRRTRRINASHKTHRPRTRTITKIRYRTRRKNGFFGRRRRRHNPSVRKSGLLMSILAGTGGAVGTRAIPQALLGTNNTGIVGYGANGITAAALAWIAKKFMGRSAGYAALLGGGISIALRLAQDYSPIGKSVFALSGDPGMGMLLPSNFTNPPLYTGNGAQVKIPTGWGGTAVVPAAAPAGSSAAPAAKGAAMGSTYRMSTYR